MIIWEGRGYLIAAVVFGSALTVQITTDGITGDRDFYRQNPWPIPFALAIAGGAIQLMQESLFKDRDRLTTDRSTGLEVWGKTRDSLFFIPAKIWPRVLYIGGAALLIYNIVTAT